MTATIRSFYESAASQSQQAIERSRYFVKMSLSHLMPDGTNFKPGDKIRVPNTSLGAQIVINVAGKLLASLYPAEPWFELDIAPKYRWMLDSDQYQAARRDLFIETVKIIALLESQAFLDRRGRCSLGFRDNKAKSLKQLVGTGSTLESIGLRGYMDEGGNYRPDFGVRVYGRDQYVTERNPHGEVDRHGIKERIRPNSLTPKQREAVGVAESATEPPEWADLFTSYEYHPFSRVWVLRQEINDRPLFEDQHEFPRIFATDIDMVPGDNYGRGVIESFCAGDMASLDKLVGCLKTAAEAASKVNPVLDANSNIRPQDLEEKGPGEAILNGRVDGGVVGDVGFIRIDKTADLAFVTQTVQTTSQSLARVGMLEADAAPQGEAGRHSFGWKTVIEQMQGMMGGFFTSAADQNQVPTVHATADIATKAGLIRANRSKFMHVVSTTGLEAVGRKKRLDSALQFTQLVASLGPEAMAHIDTNVLIAMAARINGIDEPGLVKTKQQIAKEQQAIAQMQARQQMAAKAIDTMGNIAEAGGTQAIQQAAPAAA